MPSTTATVLNSHKRYFKSPSLGNLRTKPKLDIDLKANPLPRVTTCRKRTNTLSADPRRSHDSDRSITKDYAQRDDPRLGKKDSVRRHAIYTQSLYVPFHERPNIPSLPDETPRTTQNAQLSEELPTLQDYPFRSSIQTRLNKYATLPAAPSKDSLTLLDSGIPTLRSRHFNTQTSMSSIYSQDTYHSRHSSRTGSLAKTTHNISHHPIILQLLIDVEQVRQEWSSM
ncbi:hypothetical protein H0H93_015635 [Arthromyces matolae]|nr:hypothetical protein H0H93_015635 [Arthromyces matolae]